MVWLSMGIAPALDREEFAEVLKSDDAEGLEEFHSLPFEQQYLLIGQVRIDERRSETKPATEKAIALLQDLPGTEAFFREIVEAQPTWEGSRTLGSHTGMLAKIRRRWALDLARSTAPGSGWPSSEPSSSSPSSRPSAVAGAAPPEDVRPAQETAFPPSSSSRSGTCFL